MCWLRWRGRPQWRCRFRPDRRGWTAVLFLFRSPPEGVWFMSEQTNAALPRGVVQERFNHAVVEFREALGDENVLLEQEQLAPYGKIMMSVEAAEHAPSAALIARTVEEVQAVV